MRILVTGGAGFIGKHLCRRLVSEGHEVVVLDRRSMSPVDRDEDYNYFTQVINCDNEEVIGGAYQMDVRMCRPWEGVCFFDRVYHLACNASPVRYQEDPIDTIDTCYSGTKRVLDSDVNRNPATRILLASTSEIYGEPEVHPQPESYRGNVNCLGIRACYDEGKRMSECLMMDYHRQYGVDTRIARIFNTYGPGMDFDDGRVISNFVTQALKGEPLTIYGDGSQTRSFCYVDDMVEGLIRLMEYEGEECHEPHNLGNPEERCVEGIASQILLEAHGANVCWDWPKYHKHVPLPQDDPTRRCPDITRARQNLGWEPRVGLSEGLKRTVEDFRSRLCAMTSP